ncbi:hypothetical protein ACS0TY_034968 [Phlomoides rotata]
MELPDSLDGCNCCESSLCLMTNCSCFAAGIHCSESCSCKNCCNQHEFLHRVFGKKLKTTSPNLVEPEDRTPMCNCEYSRCLNDCCVCWESNVSCSNGCRCKGCLNGNIQKREPKLPDKVSAPKASKWYHQADWGPVYIAAWSMKKLTDCSHLSLCRDLRVRLLKTFMMLRI